LINILLKGINSKIEAIEAKRIYFVNFLALICFVTSIVMIVPYIVYDLHILAWVCMIFSPLYIFCFYLNTIEYYTPAKISLFVCISLNIFLLSIVLGSRVNMSVFYLPLIVILFLLYDRNHGTAFLASIVLFAIISVVGFVINNFKVDSLIHFSEEEIFFINTVFNGVSLLGTVFLSYVFVISSETALKSLSDKNKSLLNERDELYESTILLNKNAKEQEDLNELKTKLLSIISHDVRQPVNNLLSFSEIMIKSKMSEEEMHMLGGKLKESSIHVYQMLDNLLTWSYSQMNGLYPKAIAFALKGEIENEIKSAAYSIEGKKISITTNIQEDHEICFDVVMFEIVFRNILNNAIKFSPIGSNIRIYSAKENKKILLYICDEGIGISKELKEKLFLNDLSKSRYGTQNEKGAGIGLLLCKQLMDANNSIIEVKNNQLKGSTFVLAFPV
jgi:two-component system sensor histidine kinase/response regulator